MSEAREIELAETFAAVARALLAEPTLDATLHRIVMSAVETIDGCQSAGISLISRRKVTTPAASDETPLRVDAIQYETGEGPCLSAIRDHEVFCTDDLASEDRWPAFSARTAEETGVHSMLAFRLFAEEDTMGALNLYSTTPAAFRRDAQVIGSVFAAHAAVALSNAREVDGLQKALDSRALIEQAKGIIMFSTGRTSEEAFQLLAEQSQALNEKVRDVAAGIVDGAQH